MRFTQDSSSGLNVIRAHQTGELKVNDTVFRTPIIVSPSAVLPLHAIDDAQALGAGHAEPILALDPEILLLGTGARQIYPARNFRAQFLTRGIGFEVMSTGAACRTFNILIAERRRVVALLWP